MHVRQRDNLDVLPGEKSMTATFPILGLCFLGASTKLRKAIINPVCLSVHMEQLGFHWTDFIFDHFSKICRENSSFVKIRQE